MGLQYSCSIRGLQYGCSTRRFLEGVAMVPRLSNSLIFLMPKRGLEPPHPCEYMTLNLKLPILSCYTVCNCVLFSGSYRLSICHDVISSTILYHPGCSTVAVLQSSFSGRNDAPKCTAAVP